MKAETAVLNILCVVAAIALIVFAVLKALSSGDFLSIDNLFFMTVFLVLALMFAINPLLYLKSQGKLPIPFMKGSASEVGPTKLGSARAAQLSSTDTATQSAATGGPALLDAKGRAVPSDVRQIMDRMKQPRQEDT
jgi:hypothetical protein